MDIELIKIHNAPIVTQREMQAARVALIAQRGALSLIQLVNQIMAELDIWIPRMHRIWM